MKSIAILSALVLLISSPVLPAQPKGFSGKWKLDKHSAAPANAPEDLETQIKENGQGEFTIESHFQEPTNGTVPMLYLGIMADQVKLSTDGREQEIMIGPYQMTSRSTLDGNELKTDWTAAIDEGSIQGHWTQRLSDDGKHMTWEITESSANGPEMQATLSLVRK